MSRAPSGRRRWVALLGALALGTLPGRAAASTAAPGAARAAARAHPAAAARAVASGRAAARAAGPALTLDWVQDPGAIDPLEAEPGPSFDVLNAVLEGLTRVNAAGEALPAVASSWTVSPDGRTYTFHLRPARWSNGDPVTAQDFAEAWRATLDPCVGAAYPYILADVAGAAPLIAYRVPAGGCTAADQRRVAALEARVAIATPAAGVLTVTLAHPAPYWPRVVASPYLFPVDTRLAARWGLGPAGRYGHDLAHTVCDGPFVVSAWVPGSELDLRRNPRYWDAAQVHLSAVRGLEQSSAATAVALFEMGDLDVLPWVPPQYLGDLRGRPGVRTYLQARTDYLMFNVHAGPFVNPLVRAAFSEALDRMALVQQGHLLAVPADAFTPPDVHYAPGLLFSPLVPVRLDVRADPARARADLAAGLRQLHRATLGRVTMIGSPAGLAPLLAMWRQNLGVQVTAVNPTSTAQLARIVRHNGWDMLVNGWIADFDDPSNFLAIWQTGNPFDANGWSDPRYDRLLAAAEGTADPTLRARDLAQAEAVLLRQLPVAPLFWEENAAAVRPGVQGVAWFGVGADFSLASATVTSSPAAPHPAPSSRVL